MKNEVGVGLRHGAYVWNIVPHYHIVECEISCGSKWQVTHHQAICKYPEEKKDRQTGIDTEIYKHV